MNKKIIPMAITAILILMSTNAFALSDTLTWTAVVDVNGVKDSQSATASGTTEDTVLCAPDDGNFIISVVDANAYTEIYVTFNGTRAATIGLEDTNSGIITFDSDANVAANIHNADFGNAVITVAAPTSEGYYQLCVIDANGYLAYGAANPRAYCEWVGVKPDSTYTNYTMTNSDGNGFCMTINYAAFDGKIEDSTGYGRIETVFGNTYDLSGDIDFDSTITWSNSNKVEVTTSALIGQITKLTFLKPEIHSSKFEVRRNDSACSICDGITSSNGTIFFTTGNFSVYEVLDLPAGDVGAGGVVFQPTSIIAGGDIVAAVPGGMSTIVIVLIIVAIVVIVKVKK